MDLRRTGGPDDSPHPTPPAQRCTAPFWNWSLAYKSVALAVPDDDTLHAIGPSVPVGGQGTAGQYCYPIIAAGMHEASAEGRSMISSYCSMACRSSADSSYDRRYYLAWPWECYGRV